MAMNDYMYAVERSDEYLAHYGVKGMKWGVRKALDATGARRQRKLSKAWAKAEKKLAKLEKRANNGAKYTKRAAALGAGAAAAGGLAVAGTSGVGQAIRSVGTGISGAAGTIGARGMKLSTAMQRAGIRGAGKVQKASLAAIRGGVAAGKAVSGAGQAMQGWGNTNSIASGAAKAGHDAVNRVSKKIGMSGHGSKQIAEITLRAHQGLNTASKVSNNTLARAGAAAVGAGLAAGAGYNAYRAATTKRAAKKAEAWRNQMNEAFKGTGYSTNNRSGNQSNNSGNSNRNRKRRRR